MEKYVLIVDDNDLDAKAICRFVSKAGYGRIDVVQTGQAALESILKERPDIIILDINLPDCDGFELCKKIRETIGHQSSIILITGAIDKVDATLAREMGADNLTVKTTDYQILLEAIAEIASKSPLDNSSKF